MELTYFSNKNIEDDDGAEDIRVGVPRRTTRALHCTKTSKIPPRKLCNAQMDTIWQILQGRGAYSKSNVATQKTYRTIFETDEICEGETNHGKGVEVGANCRIVMKLVN